MKLIPLSKGAFALVDDEDYDRLIQLKWHLVTGYARHADRIKGTKRLKCIWMHRLIMECPNGEFVDHKDRNGLNNQKSNLRFCTQQQNGVNRKLPTINTSGYRGVSIERGRYIRAAIECGDKTIHLGSFPDKGSAARAYDKKALELYGEFAVLNFPD